ncbi:MAG: UbiA family prenyltransferase [Frankia sp.]|nr:UbiA family prenyltransferase [Frankia sp.]
MRALLRACHPQPAFAVTAIATLLVVSAGGGRRTGWVTLAVLAGQLSVGWCNDALDARRDVVAGRRDKPIATGQISRRAVGLAAVFALAASVPLSLQSAGLAGWLHIAAVASAWGYNIRLKSTIVSVAPYATSFALLPAYLVRSLPGHPAPPWWLVVAGALLGSGAHFVNTLPDLADDARTGVRGLPHRLGRRGSLLAGTGLLAAGCAVLAVSPAGPVGAAGGLLLVLAVLGGVGIVVAGRQAASRAPFGLAIAVAVCAVVLLVVRGNSLG